MNTGVCGFPAAIAGCAAVGARLAEGEACAMTLRPVAPAPIFVPEGLWTVDAERSAARFSLRHLLVATVQGRFGTVVGSVVSDGYDVDVAGLVDVTTINTGIGVRDERLRGPGFFDVERHPTIGFHAIGIRSAGGSTWVVPGDLDICGATHPLTFTATVSDGDGSPTIHARASLSRREHGLDWPGLVQAGRAVVSDRVAIELDLVLR
jgi:polyisoprenoid-binding protein YceI